jgi:lipoprotein-releasing system permease protein
VYKLLLCVRYLRTRYLAFVCIVSVMLGVATLIVVNSVMSGFSTKLKDRLRGIISDVRVETDCASGFDATTPEVEAKIMASPMGQHIEAMSPTVEMFALIQYNVRDRYGRKIPITKHVRLVGVDPERQAKVGGFSEYLVRQKNSPNPSFDLTDEAYRRLEQTRRMEMDNDFFREQQPPAPPAGLPSFLELPKIEGNPVPIHNAPIPPPQMGALPAARLPGVILGHSLAHYRMANEKDEYGEQIDRPVLLPGDEIFIATVGASGTKPVSATFIVTDYLKTEMSEYDDRLVYVPLQDLQRIRGMDDHVNAMQIKLKDGVRKDSRFIHERFVPSLQQMMPMPEARVQSWEQQQGPLLSAIDIERGILNILLFLIVGVAGFGVLAIFSMIVSEKYRDIGVMKALGASSQGIMSIFLGYGLLLGIVGCVAGTILGLAITYNINEIEKQLAKISGKQIFDRSVYYFDKIPVNVEVSNIAMINLGAVAIAVVFSILPAIRAARLHPVRALRFE